MRFEIKRSGLSRPLLSLFGATRTRAFVEVEPASVRVRFGAFDETLPRQLIVGAERTGWSLWGGLGWRIVTDGVGLIGSLSNVVRLRLAEQREVRLLPGFRVLAHNVYVSVERPDDLVEALGAVAAPRATDAK